MIGSQTNIYLSVIIHLVLLVGIFGRHGALLVRLQEDVEQTNDLDDCGHIGHHAQHVEEQIADDRLVRRQLQANSSTQWGHVYLKRKTNSKLNNLERFLHFVFVCLFLSFVPYQYADENFASSRARGVVFAHKAVEYVNGIEVIEHEANVPLHTHVPQIAQLFLELGLELLNLAAAVVAWHFATTFYHLYANLHFVHT